MFLWHFRAIVAIPGEVFAVGETRTVCHCNIGDARAAEKQHQSECCVFNQRIVMG